MTKRKPNAKRGRPKKPVDLAIVRRLASHQATQTEMAAVLGIANSTLTERMQREPELRKAIEDGRETGKSALRSKQYTQAMKGDKTLLVWLGKQYLDQKDNAKFEAEVKVTDAREELARRVAGLAERAGTPSISGEPEPVGG